MGYKNQWSDDLLMIPINRHALDEQARRDNQAHRTLGRVAHILSAFIGVGVITILVEGGLLFLLLILGMALVGLAMTVIFDWEEEVEPKVREKLRQRKVARAKKVIERNDHRGS